MALVAGDLPVLSTNSFRYLGYRDDLTTSISAVDLAMLPLTVSEMGVGSRVIECLACALPVVATFSGAIEIDEVVQRAPVSMDKNNVELVEAARRILELDSYESHKLREDARRFAEENFSLSCATRQLGELHCAVAKGGKS